MNCTEKPPIGLMPERNFLIWQNAQRVQSIIEAMQRYREVGKPIPMAWIVELDRRVAGNT